MFVPYRHCASLQIMTYYAGLSVVYSQDQSPDRHRPAMPGICPHVLQTLTATSNVGEAATASSGGMSWGVPADTCCTR